MPGRRPRRGPRAARACACADAQLDETGFVHEELAECLLALGKGGHRAHFAKAYALLTQEAWLTESEPERLARLKQLSQTDE